jgi:hypothetical protein
MPARKHLTLFKRWLTLAASVGLAATTSASAQLVEVEEPLERFEVELVVFAYREVLGSGEGLRRQPEPDERFGVMDGADLDASENPPLPEPEPEPEPEEEEEPPLIQVTRLLNEQLQMTDIRQRINRVDAYELLLHTGFSQEGVAEKWAQPISVRRLQAPTQLDGGISLHRGRFLHVNLDLTLNSSTGLGEPFKLVEQRRLRSGEIHYFDHPALGIVLTVRPEPVPEIEPEPTPEPYPVDNTADLAPGAAP